MGWLIFTFVFGAAIFGLISWLRGKSLTLTWYEWLIGAFGVLLLIGTVQHYLGSLREDYPGPGLLGALIFGIPGLVLLVLTWQLASRRQNKSA